MCNAGWISEKSAVTAQLTLTSKAALRTDFELVEHGQRSLMSLLIVPSSGNLYLTRDIYNVACKVCL